MSADLIDIMASLANIMDSETAQLALPGHRSGIAELAAAKTRLVGQLEVELGRLARETPNWMDLLNEDTRTAMADASGRLRDASRINATALERQIELSSEIMEAIAAEAQRVTGKRKVSYSATGGLSGFRLPAPISINARL